MEHEFMIFGYAFTIESILVPIIRIFIATLLGGIIGFERGKHGRAAGMRTHILVSLGSALCAMIGAFVTSGAEMGDPTRIASGVVSGIGFLGAGMILVKNSSKVTGLTTAAAMWATSAVGLAAGAGYYVGAIAGAFAIIITTSVMTVFEIRQRRDRRYYFEIADSAKTNEILRKIKTEFPASHSLDILPPKSGVPNRIGVALNIHIKEKNGGLSIVEDILAIGGIVYVVEE